MTHVVLLVCTLALASSCHSSTPANQFIVLDQLPDGLSSQSNNQLTVRTNFPGSVQFIESDSFHIDISVTSADVDELAKLQYNYTSLDEAIFLQLFEVEKAAVASPVPYVLLAVCGAAGLALLVSTALVCWWNKARRPHINNKPHPTNQDASSAPLLQHTNFGGSPPQNQMRLRASHVQAHDGYGSSEDECIRRPHTEHTQPRFGHPPSVRVRSLRADPPIVNQETGHVSDCSMPRDVSLDEPFPPPPPPEKPVVSYIKVTASDKSHDQEGIYSDIDGQTTLKVRFEEPEVDSMPDVISSQVTQSRDQDMPLYSTVNKHRGQRNTYTPRAQQDTFPDPLPHYATYQPDDELQRIYNQASNPQAPDDPYSSIHRLTGSNGGSILSERSQVLNAGRPTAALSKPHKENNMEQVELDSVGSSRSGESSRSSGMRTQSSYTDSNYSSDRRAPVYTDSDSAHSSGSSANRSRDSGLHGVRYYAHHQVGDNEDDRFVSPSASDPSSTGSSAASRLTEEPYGVNGRKRVYVKSALNGSDAANTRRTQLGRGAVPPQMGRGAVPPQMGRGGVPPHYLHTSILCCLSVLCAVTGVYSQLQATTIHIKVYAPPRFLSNAPEVYSVKHKPVRVSHTYNQQSLKAFHFQVEDTHMAAINSEKCRSKFCEQSCDPRSGYCVCREGYVLSSTAVGEPYCSDLDECSEDQYDCHEFAECINFSGHYKCQCQTGFYGNGRNCTSCSSPCAAGTYELRRCSAGQPKLCQECTAECPRGQYIAQTCTPQHDVTCTDCDKECGRGEYEYTPCNGTLNRECRDIGALPDPSNSRNVIHENRLKVSQVMSHVLHQDPQIGSLVHRFTLKRNTGVTVTIQLAESNLAPLFRAVDHGRSNDNEGFSGDSAVQQDYCPYPVPEKYELSMVLHQGVTTKATFYNCQERQARGDACAMETGYYLDAHEACETHTRFGRLPRLDENGWNVVCSRPGTLSHVFGVSAELDDLKTMFDVDQDERCAIERTECDQCPLTCAKNMQNHRGNHRCNVTAEESDNGESPRLQYCYGCCNKQDCSSACEVYSDPRCKRLRCVTGNIAEFRLQPRWVHASSVFACHIEPKPAYKIYDVEYYAQMQSDRNEQTSPPPINNRRLKATKVFEGHHPDKAIDQHTFLRVLYGSEVVGSPDLLQGNTARNEYTAGYYQGNGQSVRGNIVKTRQMFVRPKEPFGISTRLWQTEGCDTQLLDRLVVVDSGNPASSNSDPYRPQNELLVQYSDRGQYKIFNRSQTHYPFIYFEVPRESSVLAALYDVTTVRDDSTLHMQIIRDHRWNLKIDGQLQACPGYFNVKVMDSNYPSDVMFHYDVGVDCPKAFQLIFHIPTDGPDTYEKRYLVEITDSHRTIKATVVRPATTVSNDTYDTPVSYDNQGEVAMSVFSALVAVTCVVIGCLFLLLVLALLTEGKKDKAVHKTDDKVETQHLLFVVCYVTFRTAYSVAVTFTVLFLLVSNTNRGSIDTLKEFARYSQTGENTQKNEIQQIQAIVLQELNRQNTAANHTKMRCEAKLRALQATVEEMKEHMVVEESGERLMSKVALEYTKLMLFNLTENINTFKRDFSEYARRAMSKLTRTVAETSASLESNKWLAGAKNLRDAVAGKRTAQGLTTKPLLQWMGLKQQVQTLHADLSMKDFPMPNIQDFIQMETPVIDRKPTPLPKIQDITLPRNQWYFHQDEPEMADTSSQSNSPDQSRDEHVIASRLLTWWTMLIGLVIIDAIWFIHRMARTYSTAKMMLYGIPTFIDCATTAEATRRPSALMRMLHYASHLHFRVMKTDFVPKVVSTVTVGCVMYIALGVSHSLLSVKAVASIGYIESLVAPVETSYQLAKTRIKTNAYRINKFEYPFYEELVNMRTKRYQLMLNMYAELQQTTNLLHDSELCAWKKLVRPGEACNCTTASAPTLHFEGCELPPVTPQPYQPKDFGLYRRQLARSVVPFLNAARSIIVTSCHLLLMFVLILILVDLLGTVIWVYFKRFNVLRVKPMFEIEHFAAPSSAHS